MFDQQSQGCNSTLQYCALSAPSHEVADAQDPVPVAGMTLLPELSSRLTTLQYLRSDRLVYVAGTAYLLSPNATLILLALQQAQPHGMTRQELADYVQSDDADFKPAAVFRRFRRVYETFVRCRRVQGQPRYFLQINRQHETGAICT